MVNTFYSVSILIIKSILNCRKLWASNMKQKRFKKTASAQLHEWIGHCIAKGRQRNIRSSLFLAALVRFNSWQTLSKTPQTSLKELLLTEDNRVEMVIPKRGRYRTRRNINPS